MFRIAIFSQLLFSNSAYRVSRIFQNSCQSNRYISPLEISYRKSEAHNFPQGDFEYPFCSRRHFASLVFRVGDVARAGENHVGGKSREWDRGKGGTPVVVTTAVAMLSIFQKKKKEKEKKKRETQTSCRDDAGVAA